MAEDALYRASSQYRLWNFTPEKLESLRTNTNIYAAEQVKSAIKRAKRRNASEQNNGAAQTDIDVETLTPEEEDKLVSFYCTNCLQIALGEPFKFPINVAGTAVQFLKRFYLSNSPMTYHPKQIFPAALFLSTKTENMHFPLKDFADRLKTIPGLKKTNAEEILAPEYLITQALRFCFDVRHPQRALRGIFMELLQIIACAKGAAPPSWIKKPAEKLRGDLLRLPKADSAVKRSIGSSVVVQPISPMAFEKRVEKAHHEARETLRGAALVSDAYFLYTPSQIMFAALYMADPPLTEYLLGLKLDSPIRPDAEISPFANPLVMKNKILATIKDCVAVLAAHTARSFDDMMALDKKLYLARNPEKIDLVGLNRAQKRDAGEDGNLDEQVAKKRKLQREQTEKEADDLFGPALSKG